MPAAVHLRRELYPRCLVSGCAGGVGFGWVAGLGLLFVLAGVQGAELLPEEALLEREIQQILSPWQTSFEARLRGGWRDNVLLSEAAPIARAFLGASGEAFLSRNFGAAGYAEGFASLEYRNYLESSEAEDEMVAMAMVDWRRAMEGGWLTTVSLESMFQDQRLDVSDTEVVTPDLGSTILRVRGEVLTLRSVVRRDVSKTFWVEGEGRGQRAWYEYELDDTWEAGGGGALGWKPGRRSEFSLGYGYDHRWYDTEPVRDVWGGAGEGAPARETDRHEARLVWRERWDARGRFKTTVKAGLRWLRDGYSGYYDYDRVSGEIRGSYEHGPWRIEAGVRSAYYEYAVLREESGGAPPPDGLIRMVRPRRAELTAELEGSWDFWRGIGAFVSYVREQSDSNQAGQSYTVNTVSGGLRWSH